MIDLLPLQEGGVALANIMFGKVSPSGRLPYTWYTSAYTQAVHMTDMRMRPSGSYPGRTYRFIPEGSNYILYPFGYGLSYTQFSYSNLDIKSGASSGCMVQPVTMPSYCVTVTVTNTGNYPAEEVVLLFLSQVSIAGQQGHPLKSLREFARTRKLNPGEKETVMFALNPNAFKLAGGDGSLKVVTGAWRVSVGSQSKTWTVST